MSKHLVGGVASALAVALIAAGCGGGSSSSSTTGASGATGAQGAALSKSQFLAQANAICAKGSNTINTAAKQTFPKGQKPTAAQVQQFATQTVIPTVQTQIDGIRALSPPSGDEAQVTAITDAAQQGVDKLKSNPAILDTKAGNQLFAQANKLSKAYGLDKCAG